MDIDFRGHDPHSWSRIWVSKPLDIKTHQGPAGKGNQSNLCTFQIRLRFSGNFTLLKPWPSRNVASFPIKTGDFQGLDPFFRPSEGQGRKGVVMKCLGGETPLADGENHGFFPW